MSNVLRVRLHFEPSGNLKHYRCWSGAYRRAAGTSDIPAKQKARVAAVFRSSGSEQRRCMPPSSRDGVGAGVDDSVARPVRSALSRLPSLSPSSLSRCRRHGLIINYRLN